MTLPRVNGPAMAGSADVAWVQLKGGGEDAQPSVVKSAASATEATPWANGVKMAAAVVLEHTSGFASGAAPPPKKRSTALSKGASGFSENVVLSWPVRRFGSTVPLRRTFTP